MFAALYLQKAGFSTCIAERGKDVWKRAEGIDRFERNGQFDPEANYAFGEGGAGTFSDGKLTSRSKHISAERQFILESYISAGAPAEIAFLSHPHLGSDKLKGIVMRLRQEYEDLGGQIMFGTMLTDIVVQNGKVIAAICNGREFKADYFIIAPGHSAYETYRILLLKGVGFLPKNFAIGSRVEHPQSLINYAQWGKESLPGVKAAEYRLTTTPAGSLPVYTFCMCPGGIVVPANAYDKASVVNGMSNYNRDLEYANAACVAAVNPIELIGQKAGALEVLDWIVKLEKKFYDYSGSYKAAFCSISDFIAKKESHSTHSSSYPLGLEASTLWEMFPERISNSIRSGLRDFIKKLHGFEKGILLGLESKTSAPVQVIRDKNRNCHGFENLFIAGEGSGFAGGIISSGADGVRTAMTIL